GRRGGRPVHGGPREPRPRALGRSERVPPLEAAAAAQATAGHPRRGAGLTAHRPGFLRANIAGMSRETARKVLQTEAQAILGLVERIGEAYDRAVEVLLGCTGRVVVSGMGKSGLIGQKISATLSSTGTPSLYLHPAEAT